MLIEEELKRTEELLIQLMELNRRDEYFVDLVMGLQGSSRNYFRNKQKNLKLEQSKELDI